MGLAVAPRAAAETDAADRFSDGTRTKIIGGGPASLRFWPAIGTLRYNDPQTNTSGHVCGGVAIAPTWFLTAAHCVAQDADENTLKGCYPDDQNRARCGTLQVVLVAQVVQALAQTRAGNDGDTLPGWGWAVLDYEIVP